MQPTVGWLVGRSFGRVTHLFRRSTHRTLMAYLGLFVGMSVLKIKWYNYVRLGYVMLGCGLHEPFTMGRSDGCEGLRLGPTVQHIHLVLFLVSGTCSKQVKIMDFFFLV